MAHREGSLSFYLLIVASILFIGMTVLFIVDNAEKKEITAKLDVQLKNLNEAQDARKKVAADLTTLKELIVGNRAEEWTDMSLLKNYALNDELKSKAEKAINDILGQLKETPRSYGTLVEPYGDWAGLIQRLWEARNVALDEKAKASEEVVKVKKETAEELTKVRQDRDAALQQIQDLQARVEDLDSKAKTREADLLAQLDKVRDESVDQAVKLRRQINLKDNENKSIQSKLDKIEQEINRDKNIDDVEPDGKIAYVLSSSGKAWVDVGRADHLNNGIRFRVFQTVKGGKRVVKGTIEVQRVDEEMSEVRILDETDPMNPIVQGDFITSPFYNRKAEPVFVFAGTELDSKSVTKEFLEAKIQSYGAHISNKVDETTDFLVATKNYENTPEYKTARELGVTILREKDLLSYLGL